MSASDDPARTVFFGSGRFAIPILEALIALPGVKVVGVVSAPDRPAGRGHGSTATPLATRAQELELTLFRPERIRDPETVATIAGLRPALGVLADYGRIVPQAILDLPAHGILNVHPSLLPRHRGAAPIPATILAGDPTTGVTLIRMDAGLDTGPIVAVGSWPLTGTETAPELEERAAQVGAGLVARSVPDWLAGALSPHPQDDAAATTTRPLRREDGRLDPSRPATELARQVRAYRPWPGSSLDTQLGRLTVWRATPRATDGPEEPGRLVERDGRLALTTSDGLLELDEVQPAGGRPMTGDAFLRGRGRRLVAS